MHLAWKEDGRFLASLTPYLSSLGSAFWWTRTFHLCPPMGQMSLCPQTWGGGPIPLSPLHCSICQRNLGEFGGHQQTLLLLKRAILHLYWDLYCWSGEGPWSPLDDWRRRSGGKPQLQILPFQHPRAGFQDPRFHWKGWIERTAPHPLEPSFEGPTLCRELGSLSLVPKKRLICRMGLMLSDGEEGVAPERRGQGGPPCLGQIPALGGWLRNTAPEGLPSPSESEMWPIPSRAL